MDRFKWIIFGVICTAILGGLILINKQDDVKFNGDASKVITEGPIGDQVYGSNEQKVVLIEYGDFQCPGCGAMYDTIKAMKETYKDSLTFVFRNLPLTNIHPNALAAATVAEAAGLQGKFWEMHDKLYETQDVWKNAGVSDRTGTFEKYAQELGLDVAKFTTDLANKDIASKIERDRSTAKGFGATSTPTFVLNGQKIPETTATNPDALKKAVKEALQQAGFNPIDIPGNGQ